MGKFRWNILWVIALLLAIMPIVLNFVLGYLIEEHPLLVESITIFVPIEDMFWGCVLSWIFAPICMFYAMDVNKTRNYCPPNPNKNRYRGLPYNS